MMRHQTVPLPFRHSLHGVHPLPLLPGLLNDLILHQGKLFKPVNTSEQAGTLRAEFGKQWELCCAVGSTGSSTSASDRTEGNCLF